MKKKIKVIIVIYVILLVIPLIGVEKMGEGMLFEDMGRYIKWMKMIKKDEKKYVNKLKNSEKEVKKDQERIIGQEKKIRDREKEQLKELKAIITTGKIIGGKIKDEENDDIENRKKYQKKEKGVKNEIRDDKIIKSDGFFKILNLSTGKIDQITEKDYVMGAVCAEMPPTFHPEALKAQAVCAHTYALKMKQEQIKHPDSELKGADFSADPNNWNKFVTQDIAKQKYKNRFAEYWNIIESAVNDVIDIVMLYDDEPIIATYHAISSGKTESAHDIWGGIAPYLIPAESHGDKLAPNYETKKTFSSSELKNILIKNFPKITLSNRPSQWFRDIERSDSGTVLKVIVDDDIITGAKLRNILNLRSANFQIDYDQNKDIFNIDVKGYGHDIGLSQYGANYMANNGANFKEILNHYYNNINFAKVSKIT